MVGTGRDCPTKNNNIGNCFPFYIFQEYMEEQNNQENQQDTNSTLQNKVTPLIHPVAAAFIGLAGGFFLYQVIGGGLTVLIFGMDIEKAPVNLFRLITLANQVLFILLPALLFSRWIYKDVSAIIKLRIPNWKEILLFVVGIIILTPLLQSYLYIQNHFIEVLAKNFSFIDSIKKALDHTNEILEKIYGGLISADSLPEAILVVFVVAVTPAICEEFMFRGFIQRSFEFKLKPFWAALVTAIFFGLNHFSPYGIIPLIALGFYFGFAAYLSNSILIPVLLHFINNFAAVLIYFIIGDDELISSAPTTDVDIQTSIITFFILLIIFSGLIILIKRFYSKQNLSGLNIK